MKILYGIQATGNGHISRSREIVRELKRAGHELEIIISGRERSELWDMEVFEPFSLRRGITFKTRNGRIHLIRSLMSIRAGKFVRDLHSITPDDIDLVISDFEPITAHFARQHKIPSMGIGRQYALQYPLPDLRNDHLSQMIFKYYSPVSIPVGLHWYHHGHPILPPIVPKTIREMIAKGTRNGSFFLVYLPFENPKHVLQFLRLFPETDFRFYTQYEGESTSNVELMPHSRTGFIESLSSCSGVFCNAGFELASEALAFGKKLLVKPVLNQPEQVFNASALSSLGLGQRIDRLDYEVFSQWLNHNQSHRRDWPDVANAIANWISLPGNLQPVSHLAADLWAQLGDVSLQKQLQTHAEPQNTNTVPQAVGDKLSRLQKSWS